MDDDIESAGHLADEVHARLLGWGPSPLTAIEGTGTLLEMDRNEVGTPLGDLEAISPR